MSFKPAKNGQYEPVTSTSSRDCVPAVAAMLVEAATVGAIRPDHADIRKAATAAGVPTYRGLLALEARDAVWKLYRVELDVAFALSRNTLRDIVAGGAAVGVSIDTTVTRYTTRRTNYYIGGHRVFVPAKAYSYWTKGEICNCEKRTATPHGEYAVEDPGTTSAGYLQWSADLLYRAAEARGNGAIDLLIAPDTEGVTRKAVGTVELHDSPFRSSDVKKILAAGSAVTVTSTYNGGGWPRADGTTGFGWHRVPGDLYAIGRELR